MTGGRTWLALADARPLAADAAAAVRDAATGEPLGWLAAWWRPDSPAPEALRADPAALHPRGLAGHASLVLVPRGRAVPFDDLAVQRARQLVLAAAGRWTTVTTLVDDAVHFRGSVLAAPDRIADDPFELVAPARRLAVGPGLLSPGPLRLPAPHVERWAGRPWPQSGFERCSTSVRTS